jgi:hypothetical protein
MEIVKILWGEIKPYENNVKQHPRKQIDQIKASIKEFGNNDPIAIDENNVVIEGHGRLMALGELGYTEVECIRLVGLSEEQKKAYRLVHNKLTMNSDFEVDDLLKELNEIIAIDMAKYDFSSSSDELEMEAKPDVSFTEVLGEEHNYIVLYFDNDVDWLQAQSFFDIKPVMGLSSRKDGKEGPAGKRIGTGRVLKGSVALEKVLKNENIG